MTGETDLAAMLSSLTVGRRAGAFVVLTTETPPAVGDGIEAVIVEAEGPTVIADVEAARARGWTTEPPMAWLTLEVHSSLMAVGLTAAFSHALGEAGIPCNVLAGYYHDHILVPIDMANDAIACLDRLRDQPCDQPRERASDQGPPPAGLAG